jgi:hypothetical protein
MKNAIFYAFIMRLKVEERVFILESYLKTMPYVHCRQSFVENFLFLREELASLFICWVTLAYTAVSRT